METSNSPVEKHYTREKIFETIVERLESIGISKDKVTRKDISGVDEFHIRGGDATIELAQEAGFTKDSKVLDVGCGIGGPARMIADEFGCKVTGVDLTEEFIRTARLLSELVGLKDLTEFITADATNLPIEDETFDIAWTQHAQMNIKEKKKLYSEIYRVLKKGGRFIYFDIFSGAKGDLIFPLPWADDASLSHLIATADYEKLLSDIGFKKIDTKDQTEESTNFIKTVMEKTAKEGPPAMGLNLLMKETTGMKLGNVLKNLNEGKIEIHSGTFEK